MALLMDFWDLSLVSDFRMRLVSLGHGTSFIASVFWTLGAVRYRCG
jgi:hypothetical protein